MTIPRVVLDKQDLAALGAEFSLGKPMASSGAVAGRGCSRYVITTAKGRFELRLVALEDEYEIRRELDLLSFFEKHDFPAPRPVSNPQGQQFCERNGVLLFILKVPSGNRVAEERLSLRQINAAGHAVGRMHLVGRSYKKTVENRYGFDHIFETYAAARRRMPPYFKKVVRTLDEEVEYLGNYLETKLPKGIIHGVIHRESFVFKGDQVLCMGDFEAACRGKYVLDLATAVNALCFADSSYSLDRFEAMMAGYESLRTLSLAEWDSFPNELRFAALRFAVVRLYEFFEADDDEERARINDDFRAYLDRLRVLRREKEGGMEKLLMAMATGYDYRKYQRVKSGDGESGG